MRYNATHRATGRTVTPFGKIPSSRALVGGAMLSGMLLSGAATATAASASDVGAPAGTTTSTAAAAGSTAVGNLSASSAAIVDTARQALGTDYSWGGTTLSGMDCSGLVVWAYGQAGIDLKGNRTADQLMRGGESIAVSEAQPGDLVGYKTGGDKYTHIAIYLGDGKVIDASNNNDVVVERSMWSDPDWHAVTYR